MPTLARLQLSSLALFKLPYHDTGTGHLGIICGLVRFKERGALALTLLADGYWHEHSKDSFALIGISTIVLLISANCNRKLKTFLKRPTNGASLCDVIWPIFTYSQAATFFFLYPTPALLPRLSPSAREPYAYGALHSGSDSRFAVLQARSPALIRCRFSPG